MNIISDHGLVHIWFIVTYLTSRLPDRADVSTTDRQVWNKFANERPDNFKKMCLKRIFLLTVLLVQQTGRWEKPHLGEKIPLLSGLDDPVPCNDVENFSIASHSIPTNFLKLMYALLYTLVFLAKLSVMAIFLK